MGPKNWPKTGVMKLPRVFRWFFYPWFFITSSPKKGNKTPRRKNWGLKTGDTFWWFHHMQSFRGFKVLKKGQ